MCRVTHVGTVGTVGTAGVIQVPGLGRDNEAEGTGGGIDYRFHNIKKIRKNILPTNTDFSWQVEPPHTLQRYRSRAVKQRCPSTTIAKKIENNRGVTTEVR